jgi:hypothetical protein
LPTGGADLISSYDSEMARIPPLLFSTTRRDIMIVKIFCRIIIRGWLRIEILMANMSLQAMQRPFAEIFLAAYQALLLARPSMT